MRVYLLDAKRTPFRKVFTGFEKFTHLELSRLLLNRCLEEGWENLKIDAVYFGSVMLDPEYPNLARELVIRSNLSNSIPAHFLSNYCITSLSALDSAFRAIQSGVIDCAIFGGVEMMSRLKLFFSQLASDKFITLSKAKNFWQKALAFLRFSIKDFKPLFPSPREPSTGLTMGESCEAMNWEYKVTREEQDKLALKSHQRAFSAKDFVSNEIIPIANISNDNLIRGDTSLDKLSSLKPVFSQNGTLTAGNSSALTDGASFGILVSERFAEQNRLNPIGEIVDTQFAAIDPNDGLLMAPVVAIDRLLKRNKLRLSDIEILEIHEAFACQVLCNLKKITEGWEKYNTDSHVLSSDFNLWGGSLAYGHPFAATGVRLISFAARQLAKYQKKLALVSSCAAGGGGSAVLLKAI